MELETALILSCCSFIFILMTVTTTTGWYYLEKIFGMSKTQKSVYQAAKNALQLKQYELIDISWVYGDSRRASYDIVFNLSMGQLRLNTLHCETLFIKTSNGQFESCSGLSSSHLIMLCRNFAEGLLLDQEKKEESERQQRVLSAQNKIVSLNQ